MRNLRVVAGLISAVLFFGPTVGRGDDQTPTLQPGASGFPPHADQDAQVGAGSEAEAPGTDAKTSEALGAFGLSGAVPLDDSEIGDVSVRGAEIMAGGDKDLPAAQMGSNGSPDLESGGFGDSAPKDVGRLPTQTPGTAPILPTSSPGIVGIIRSGGTTIVFER